MLRILLCALALLVSTSAIAASASFGLGEQTIELIDLDPVDGIEPLHDISLRNFFPEHGDAIYGPVDSEQLQPYGQRYFTTGPDAFWSETLTWNVYGTTLSPMTAAVFSASAFVAISVAGRESASAGVSLFAGDDFDGIGVSSSRGPTADSRILSVRLDNLSTETVAITYGWHTEFGVASGTFAPPPPIPEPQRAALLLLALPLLAAAVRRRRAQRA